MERLIPWLWVSDMKRTAPSEEPLDVSSGDSSGSDADQEAGKGKGGSVSKAAAAAGGESFFSFCSFLFKGRSLD
jgi:hypothetical protein